MEIMNTSISNMERNNYMLHIKYKKTFWQFLTSKPHSVIEVSFRRLNKRVKINPNQTIHLGGINPKKVDLNFSTLEQLVSKHFNPYKKTVVSK